MFSLRLIACVLTTMCGAFLAIPCAWFVYESFAHFSGNLPIESGIFGAFSIVGLMGMYASGSWFYAIAYDKGFNDGMHQGWLDSGQLDKRNNPPTPPEAGLYCFKDDNPDWGSIYENTDTKKCLHPPLVKLGQGDYERHITAEDVAPTGKVTEEDHRKRME